MLKKELLEIVQQLAKLPRDDILYIVCDLSYSAGSLSLIDDVVSSLVSVRHDLQEGTMDTPQLALAVDGECSSDIIGGSHG